MKFWHYLMCQIAVVASDQANRMRTDHLFHSTTNYSTKIKHESTSEGVLKNTLHHTEIRILSCNRSISVSTTRRHQ